MGNSLEVLLMGDEYGNENVRGTKKGERQLQRATIGIEGGG